MQEIEMLEMELKLMQENIGRLKNKYNEQKQ